MSADNLEERQIRDELTDPRIQALVMIMSAAASIVTLLVMFVSFDVVVAFSSVGTFVVMIVLLLSGWL